MSRPPSKRKRKKTQKTIKNESSSDSESETKKKETKNILLTKVIVTVTLLLVYRLSKSVFHLLFVFPLLFVLLLPSVSPLLFVLDLPFVLPLLFTKSVSSVPVKHSIIFSSPLLFILKRKLHLYLQTNHFAKRMELL